tara:strand:+ start:540 stop:983 length:444 start_codon:yes stop_codon:yes gene_type:complete
MTTETTNIETTATIIGTLNPLAKAVIVKLTSSEFIQNENHTALISPAHGLINFFIVSIDCFEKLELTYLKQLASDYLKLKCAHRDLGSAMVIDYTEADFSDLRKIRTKVWNNAQKVLHEIVVTMKQYQSCNESETAGGNSLPICGKR